MIIDVYDIGHERPIVVYRRLIDPAQCGRIASRLDDTLGKVSFEESRAARMFKASKIINCKEVCDTELLEVIEEIAGSTPRTVRRNTQGSLGRQGWHTDYVPLATVLNLRGGTGRIEFKTIAQTIEDARSRNVQVDQSIDVDVGDVTIIGCGDERYHRGINLGKVIRENLVFH